MIYKHLHFHVKSHFTTSTIGSPNANWISAIVLKRQTFSNPQHHGRLNIEFEAEVTRELIRRLHFAMHQFAHP